MKSVLILSSVGFWSLCNSYLSKNSFKLGQKGRITQHHQSHRPKISFSEMSWENLFIQKLPESYQAKICSGKNKREIFENVPKMSHDFAKRKNNRQLGKFLFWNVYFIGIDFWRGHTWPLVI